MIDPPSPTSPANATSTIAVFDFDGTLTHRDSLLPFLRAVVGQSRFYGGLLRLSPVLLAYKLGLIKNWRAKEAVLTYFLKGRSVEQIETIGQTFAAQTLPALLRPEAMQRLQAHQQQGHQTLLVSASLEAYLCPWAKTVGFDHVVGTQLVSSDNRLTGKIQGKNCYGAEKVRRLRAMLGDLTPYCIYAYGDSRGDKELLAIANYPYYRRFRDTAEGLSEGGVPHWERGLLISVITAAAFYLGMVLWSGADRFWQSLDQIPAGTIPLLLSLVFAGYCLRFIRWQWYLHQMGYSVPVSSSFQIFLASFALTASPGKAGESIKSILLKRRHNIPIAPTLAGLFCERFTDALSVVLLICFSVFSMTQGLAAVAIVGGLQVGIILALQQSTFIKQTVLKPLAQRTRLQPLIHKLETLIDSASTLLKPRILVGGTLLPLMGWSLEGIALYIIFRFLGVDSITPYQAILIHTASGLLGVLSLLPGGIGSNEVLSVGLSVLYGASQATAVTATFLIRLMTLWFAVAIGIVAMMLLQLAERRMRNSS